MALFCMTGLKLQVHPEKSPESASHDTMPLGKTDASMGEAQKRAAGRMAPAAVTGRYHYLPKRLESDYDISSDVLGSGFNGSVISAICRRTGTECAVKKLKLRGAEPSIKKAFANEVEIFLSMDHPHVARLMQVYEADGKLSLVMECCSGGELFDRAVQKKQFPEQEAAQATWQMLLAVNYLHHEGVSHRDLKLENFLYDAPGSSFLKLIDFGFSKYCEKGEKMHEALGSLHYIAPEVYKQNYSGGSCDMWSLGVITYILLVGSMPFDSKSKRELVTLIKTGDYEMNANRWSNVTEDGKDFVRSLLVVNPARRMTAQQALGHSWIRGQVERDTGVIRSSLVQGFISLAKGSCFRRACLQVMAWSLSLDDRRKLRDGFIELGSNQDGVVMLKDIERLMRDDFEIPSDDLRCMLDALESLDADCDGELHYSDFLAGMMATKLEHGLEDEQILQETFHRFDFNDHGYITPEAVQAITGIAEHPDGAFERPSLEQRGQMNVNEFMTYLRMKPILVPIRKKALAEVKSNSERLRSVFLRLVCGQGGA